MPLSQFQNTFGLDIHIEYTDGKYADAQQVLADLQYLNIYNVRDGVPSSQWPGQGVAGLKLLASNGIHFDFLTSCNTPAISTVLSELDTLETTYPGIALSVEGTNEINNAPCTIGGGSNEQNAEAWQQQLYKNVHADPLLLGVPVLYMTGAAPIGNLSGFADAANTHPYPYQGVQPFARLNSDFLVEFPDLAVGVPRQITETGYATDLSNNSNAVNEMAQAIMGFNIYFDAALEGIARTYVYQLLEAYPKPDGDTSYGLFHYDGTPKVMAVALHNLAQLMPVDPPSQPALVAASVRSLPQTAHQIAFTAADGSVYVFAWNEVPVWDQANQVLLPYNHTPYSVALPGKWKVQYLSPAASSPIEDTYVDGEGGFYAWLETYPTGLHFTPLK